MYDKENPGSIFIRGAGVEIKISVSAPKKDEKYISFYRSAITDNINIYVVSSCSRQLGVRENSRHASNRIKMLTPAYEINSANSCCSLKALPLVF